MDLMDKIESLAKRRGFVYPGSEIYGGLANSWDYGPLGVELKRNIANEWWRFFVTSRADIVGIEPAVIMNPKVWEASGHLAEFIDPLIECKKCHGRFREDEIKIPRSARDARPSNKIEDFDKDGECPNCGAHEFAKSRQFNLLFKTYLGPLEDSSAQVYLRGELAQAMFVDFKNIINTTRVRVPFGIAAVGRVFRNEITPGNFIFRTREFDLMEFEYFVREAEWEKYFEYWLSEMHRWTQHLGIDKKKLHDTDVPKDGLAHYSTRTVDIEYDFPFGRKELYGLAYRTDFDLKNHMKKSGEDLHYTDPRTKEKFTPHVVEPTFGLDRSVLVALLEAYTEEKVSDETRVVMKFPYWVTPVKVGVFPLLSNNEDLIKEAHGIFKNISGHFVAQYDDSGAIGRRYRRHDEIGTPICITIDHDTLKDKTVTLRERDSMKQIRVKSEKLLEVLARIFNGEEFLLLGKEVK